MSAVVERFRRDRPSLSGVGSGTSPNGQAGAGEFFLDGRMTSASIAFHSSGLLPAIFCSRIREANTHRCPALHAFEDLIRSFHLDVGCHSSMHDNLALES